VNRGGGWGYDVTLPRVANRNVVYSPTYTSNFLGFRIARTVP
jgi:formylglycine-generating enzyme required for sulfatase activity